MQDINSAPIERGPTPPWPERHPVVSGITALLVLHVLLIWGPLRGITPLKPAAEPFLIGVVQLGYVLPVSLVFLLAGYRKTLKAFAWAALGRFVINVAACGALVYVMNKGW